MQIDIKRLQGRLGVTADGIFGIGSFTAYFRYFGAPQAIAEELALAATVHLPQTEIMGSALRLAHFTPQLCHESGGFRYMEEIASGAAYEGRRDLGNTQPGDGRRYKGRGPIQITGRSNYRRYGRMAGIDIERWPDLASKPSIGFQLGCLYWKDKGLNARADNDDILGITKSINGGTNGLQDRRQWLAKAKALIL